ncbi:hypothetical protein FSARC_14977 [Fusarium sarcochroum]|uniref:Uncharacterized protein n=1 Tax=Fusarium sarcochroum TaxID=1208366 RepID=A0A8H4SPQ9_9HYPO|nr:hypothetical protein FSARC_14977 [Fusarium sarcochroum]
MIQPNSLLRFLSIFNFATLIILTTFIILTTSIIITMAAPNQMAHDENALQHLSLRSLTSKQGFSQLFPGQHATPRQRRQYMSAFLQWYDGSKDYEVYERSMRMY